MADTAIDKVHVVNRALIKLGLPASYTIDGEDSLGGTVDEVWPGVLAEVILMAQPSAFRQTLAVTEIPGAPDNGWTYGFVLPATRIGEPLAILSNVVNETYLRQFMLEGGKLFTNVKPVWVRCRVELDPQYWDAAFLEAFTIALASGLAVPLLQDDDTAMMLRARAFGDPREQGRGGMFGNLASLERAAQPQGRNFLANDILTAARL
jgi:hypothetical protein